MRRAANDWNVWTAGGADQGVPALFIFLFCVVLYHFKGLLAQLNGSFFHDVANSAESNNVAGLDDHALK